MDIYDQPLKPEKPEKPKTQLIREPGTSCLVPIALGIFLIINLVMFFSKISI